MIQNAAQFFSLPLNGLACNSTRIKTKTERKMEIYRLNFPTLTKKAHACVCLLSSSMYVFVNEKSMSDVFVYTFQMPLHSRELQCNAFFTRLRHEKFRKFVSSFYFYVFFNAECIFLSDFFLLLFPFFRTFFFYFSSFDIFDKNLNILS